MDDYACILVDRPRPGVLRITFNRPEKRNALNNRLRHEMFEALHRADNDPETRVSVLRGAGSCFSSGYDLTEDLGRDRPWFTSPGEGDWARHVNAGWFDVWDLGKPVIAQVHGYCLAGATELAAACDLLYVSADARIGYPVVRSIAPPDMQWLPWYLGIRRAMEMMLTGDFMSGEEAARAGFANRAFPAEKVEAGTLEMAERVSKIPTDLQRLNKRTVHQAMEVMGVRTAIRAGTYLHALAWYQDSSRRHMEELRRDFDRAVRSRDTAFGDYGAAGAPGDGSVNESG